MTYKRDLTFSISALALICYAIAATRIEAFEKKENVNILQSRRNPYLLNGLKINFDRDTIIIRRHYSPQLPERRLLIVVDDRCSACSEALPRLEAFLEKGNSLKTEFDIVSTGGVDFGEKLFRAATRSGSPTVLLKPIQTTAYTVRTGLSATPLIVLLDSQNRLRAYLRGVNDAGLWSLKKALTVN